MDKSAVIGELKKANERYVETGRYRGKVSSLLRKKCAAGQHPKAVILTCSDARVIPEAIFGAGTGELFVIRTAGNTVGKTELGSIEYAVSHLGVRTVVILGHTCCGAVSAALAGHFEGAAGYITKRISKAIGRESDPTAAARENARAWAKTVRAEIDAEVFPALYDIASGKVTFDE